MLSNGHAGCGGRARETGRSKYRYRALARPYPTKSSLAWWRAGRPTVREAETFGGIGMSNKRMPVGESQQETGAGFVLLLQVASYRITGRIPGESGPGPKGR